jgi:hypothetical protein
MLISRYKTAAVHENQYRLVVVPVLRRGKDVQPLPSMIAILNLTNDIDIQGQLDIVQGCNEISRGFQCARIYFASQLPDLSGKVGKFHNAASLFI